jgi:Ran-binding protein 1
LGLVSEKSVLFFTTFPIHFFNLTHSILNPQRTHPSTRKTIRYDKNSNEKKQVKLEEVEVKSGEEDEETLCSYRSKLFIYGETLLDKGTGNKTWRERGIGEARILRHNEHQRIRFLMRQEKTMKVIANHALDPRIKLEPNAGSDRSWVWSAYDFAEGELEEKVFALRFANSDVASEFKDKYEKYQKEMESLLAGEDKPDESGEADKAAEALSGLKTTDDEE